MPKRAVLELAARTVVAKPRDLLREPVSCGSIRARCSLASLSRCGKGFSAPSRQEPLRAGSAATGQAACSARRSGASNSP